MPKKQQKTPAVSIPLEDLLKASALRRLQQEPSAPGRSASKAKTKPKKAKR